jgi:hypothetical protein
VESETNGIKEIGEIITRNNSVRKNKEVNRVVKNRGNKIVIMIVTKMIKRNEKN